MGRTTRIGEVSWQLRAQAVLSRNPNLGLVYQLSCLANPHTSNYNLRLCLRFCQSRAVSLCARLACTASWVSIPNKKEERTSSNKIKFFFFFKFYYVSLCLWTVRGQLVYIGSPSSFGGHGDWTHVNRLGCRHLYSSHLLSHDSKTKQNFIIEIFKHMQKWKTIIKFSVLVILA